MRSFATTTILVFALALMSLAQQNQTQVSPGASAAKSNTQGITREQADAILKELRQIRKLLEIQAARTQAAVPAQQPAPAPTQAAREMAKLPIGSDWQWMGKDDAPVSIVEFTDYQCPFCRRFEANVFSELKKNYIDTGKVRFASRDLPLDFHNNAMLAAQAARCAGEQGKFWEMRETLIANSTDLSRNAIEGYAGMLLLNNATFRGCLDAEKFKGAIESDQNLATSIRIEGTPTFVIAKTSKDSLDGEIVMGAQRYETFESVIRKAMQ